MLLRQVDSQTPSEAESVGSNVIVGVFDQIFGPSDATVLRGGAEEPLYQPDAGSGSAIVYFRHDYLRSALHEVAHWCLAGSARRRFTDYGYWYTPDNRDEVRQAAFYQVEVRPQALEWIFCDTLGISFSVSLDNFGVTSEDIEACTFKSRVQLEKSKMLEKGLPARAHRFNSALGAVAYADKSSYQPASVMALESL